MDCKRLPDPDDSQINWNRCEPVVATTCRLTRVPAGWDAVGVGAVERASGLGISTKYSSPSRLSRYS